jgi:hypothetical protein
MQPTPRARPGTAALLVLTASAGVLLAFGWKEGDPAKAFRNAGRMLLGSAELPAVALPLTATLLGVVHHVVVASLWGAMLGLATRPFRGGRYLLAALALSVTFSLLNLWTMPPMFGVGFSVLTSVARAVPFALALTVALLVTPWASGVGE